MSLGASGRNDRSHSTNNNYAGFPGQFVSTAGRVVGQPLTLEELLAGLPQTTGLFGSATPVGPMGGGGTSLAEPQNVPAADPGGFPPGPNLTGLTTKDLGPLGYRPGDYVPGFGSVDPASVAPRDRITPATSDTGMGLFNRTGLVNTGIGAAPNSYAAPGSVLSGVNPINAPTVTGVNASLSPTNYNDLQSSLFQANYQPAAAEINRQGAIQDRSLTSMLANSGLASSGAGIGQVQRQQQERSQQLGTLGTTAASQAAVQRYGLQSSEMQANAARQQEANLASAGFSQQAQVANAANVLAGNTTNAKNYLDTIGLNEQTAKAARDSFLSYLNIGEQDLARMDATNHQNLSTALDTWLKQYAMLGDIGRMGLGATESKGQGGGVDASYGGGGGTSGGGSGS